MRRLSVNWIAAVLAASCVCAGFGAAAANKPSEEKQAVAADRNVLVKTAKTTFYESASTKSKRLAFPTQLTPCKVLSRQGEFTEVEIGGKKGFIHTQDLTRNPFVSVDGKLANVRSGPSGKDPIIFRLYNHYPLKVVEKRDTRIQVMDYEGDTGWVFETLLCTKPYVIVRLPQINVRDQPGLDKDGNPLGKRRFVAEKGVVFEVLEEKDGWLKIQHTDGDIGWCSGNIVWGYFEED